MNKKKVLLVDDEQKILQITGEIFAAEGYEVDKADNGNMALDKVKEFAPDVILLDVTMPETNGYEVCRTLKQDERYKSIPVIMITAKSKESDRFWGKEVGADRYMTKPFDNDELLEEVAKVLQAKPKASEEGA